MRVTYYYRRLESCTENGPVFTLVAELASLTRRIPQKCSLQAEGLNPSTNLADHSVGTAVKPTQPLGVALQGAPHLSRHTPTTVDSCKSRQ